MPPMILVESAKIWLIGLNSLGFSCFSWFLENFSVAFSCKYTTM